MISTIWSSVAVPVLISLFLLPSLVPDTGLLESVHAGDRFIGFGYD